MHIVFFPQVVFIFSSFLLDFQWGETRLKLGQVINLEAMLAGICSDITMVCYMQPNNNPKQKPQEKIVEFMLNSFFSLLNQFIF